VTPYRQVPAPTVSETDEVSHSRHKSLLTAKNDKTIAVFNSVNAKLNPICHLLALLGAHHILHVSRIRVNKPPSCNAQQNGVTAPHIPSLGNRWRRVTRSTMRPISCRQKALATIG
jgi:hypothetical protein